MQKPVFAAQTAGQLLHKLGKTALAVSDDAAWVELVQFVHQEGHAIAAARMAALAHVQRAQRLEGKSVVELHLKRGEPPVDPLERLLLRCFRTHVFNLQPFLHTCEHTCAHGFA